VRGSAPAPRRDRPGPTALAGLAVASVVASVATVVLVVGITTLVVGPGSGPRVADAPEGDGSVPPSGPDAAVAAADARLAPDLCLELDPGTLGVELAEADAREALAAAVAARPDLFPDPVVEAHAVSSSGGGSALRLGAWAVRGSEATASARSAALADQGCAEPGLAWSARVSHALLADGAERRASSVSLAPGVTAHIGVELHPSEGRVRTALDFSMPLGMGGVCWVDDRLGVDAAGGGLTVATEVGQEVTPFAEYACERFLDLMPEGGAGEQAASLVPGAVRSVDGSPVRLGVAGVRVESGAVVVSGAPAGD
jgi:hypothetical protein